MSQLPALLCLVIYFATPKTDSTRVVMSFGARDLGANG
jgi:hypothetical protein